MTDVTKLNEVIRRLADADNSLVIAESNLDIIETAACTSATTAPLPCVTSQPATANAFATSKYRMKNSNTFLSFVHNFTLRLPRERLRSHSCNVIMYMDDFALHLRAAKGCPFSMPGHSNSGAKPAKKPSRPQAKAAPSSKAFRLPRVVKLAALDLLLIAIGLVIFAYFHHVRQEPYSMDDVIVVPHPTVTPAPTQEPPVATQENAAPADAAPTAVPTPEPTIDPNDWGAKFAGRFTDGEIEKTDTSYRSHDVSITIERHSNEDTVWFVADIYLRNVESYRTALARDVFGKGYHEWPLKMAQEKNAILAISGDYCGTRTKGVVVRNGVVYRKTTFKDVCLLYYDGVMETMPAKQFNADAAIARGVYQAFSFGPALLDANGKAMEEYDTEIERVNPRCAIGYYEPGHYCFVVVDGRQSGYSRGMTIQQLAQTFEALGCKAAYNLDGGKTAVMIFDGKKVNTPADGGRKISDIVYIGEVAE